MARKQKQKQPPNHRVNKSGSKSQNTGPAPVVPLDPRLFSHRYDSTASAEPIENQNDNSEQSNIALLDAYNKRFTSEEMLDRQLTTTDAPMTTSNADSSPYSQYPQLTAHSEDYQQWRQYSHEHSQFTYAPASNTTKQLTAPPPSTLHNTPSSSSLAPTHLTSQHRPKEKSLRARQFGERLEAVNGVIIPSKIAIGQIPSKPMKLAHDYKRDRVCPICGSGFGTNYQVQSHFISCVGNHGNPRGAKWDDDITVAAHRRKKGPKLRDVGQGSVSGSNRSTVYRSRSQSPWGCFND